jgi:hypothetical protein
MTNEEAAESVMLSVNEIRDLVRRLTAATDKLTVLPTLTYTKIVDLVGDVDAAIAKSSALAQVLVPEREKLVQILKAKAPKSLRDSL